MKGILKTKDYESFQVGEHTFSGAHRAGKALVGDYVEMADESEGRVSKILLRASHSSIVGTLEIAGKTKYGYTSRNVPIYLFVPWNEAYPPFYVGSSHADKSINVIATVDFESWHSNANCPRGNLRKILGVSGNLEAEEAALKLYTHPVAWKKGLEIQPRIPFLQGGSILDTDTFHVDPEGCVDIDDAISVWPNGSTIELRIHIADVASLLSNNQALWTAERLGETLYKDGAIVSPLFPNYVQDACSLTPYNTRPTLTLGITWCTESKSMIKKWWIQQDIIVKDSYTYDTFYLCPKAPLLYNVVSGLVGRNVNDSHTLIEQLMLLYNKEAANVIYQARSGILRCHSQPDNELLANLEKGGISPLYLAYKAGSYCDSTASDTSHWGLKEAVYCHASSPIRRWVDCINQGTIIKSLFVPEIVVPPYNIDSINAQQRLVKSFERDLFFMKMLLASTTKRVEGHVILAGPQKAKIWVPEWNSCVSLYEYMNVGDHVELSVHMDVSKKNWKRRLILEVLE
jgi:exoribonuclease R